MYNSVKFSQSVHSKFKGISHMSEKKNDILRENATTQKTIFMDACTHTMGRLTALGVYFVTRLDRNAP